METVHSSGFTSEASMTGKSKQQRSQPHTPPYTPHKRRLERSDSPASTSGRSIHPAETVSPAKKAIKRAAQDNVKVEEVTERDLGYASDIDVVYPESLSEVNSETDGDDERSSSDDDEHSDSGIARRMSKLQCADGESESEVVRRRLERRSRRSQHKVKRTHSQSVKSDTEVTDPDAMDDQDVEASARRLRRRTRGPAETKMSFGGVLARSSPEVRDFATTAASRPGSGAGHGKLEPSVPFRLAESDVMDVDDVR